MNRILARRRLPLLLTIVSILLPVGSSRAQVAMNELMFAPVAPEPEWIEIQNITTAEIILDGWRIEDASGSVCRIESGRVAAGAFLILTEDTAALRLRRAAAGIVLLQADLPSLNNDADRLALRDAAGRTIDSIRYAASWSTIPRSSLERRSATAGGTAAQSWGSSRDSSGATPGRRNSISPPRIDITVDSARFEPAGRLVIASIRNAGTTAAPSGSIHLYRDRDGDAIGSSDEEIALMATPALSAGKSTLCTLAIPEEPVGSRGDGIIRVITAGDEVEGDDMVAIELPAGSAGAGIIINEIMFDPVPIDEESGSEYIELHNISAEPIEVAGWKLYDRSERAQATIPLATAAIPGGGYLLVASDSSIYRAFPALRDSTNVVTINRSSFSLNLDEDDVRLRDGSGRTIDSVTYRSDWHWSELAGTRGISLERISPGGSSTDRRNWSSSVASAGGTPAGRNSRALELRATEATLAATPDILSPDNDGRDDFTRISWRLPRAASIITIALYDRHGRLLTRIIDNEPAAAVGETIWNGLDRRGERVPPGIYLLMLEGGDVVAKSKVVVAGG